MKNNELDIKRDFTKRPVIDFKTNVQTKLNDKLIAEEVREGSLLIGWKIVSLMKEGIL